MSQHTQFGRREFLSASGSAILVTGSGVGSAETETNGVTDPSNEVERLGYMKHTNHEQVKRSNEKPRKKPVYYTIPRRQWLRNEGAVRAANVLSQRFDSDKIRAGITNKVSGPRTVGVKVRYIIDDSGGKRTKPDATYEQVERSIPSAVSVDISADGKRYTSKDIPVKLELDHKWEQDCTPAQSHFWETYRPVPAGVEAGNGVDSDCAAYSLASPAWHDNWGYGITTAAHCINRTEGESVYQNSFSSDNLIGYSREYTPRGRGDMAFIERDESIYVGYDIGAEGGGTEDWRIHGTVQRDRLVDMTAAEEYVYVQARMTGRHYGKITGHEENTDIGDQVFIDADTEGGDSGGVYFEKRSGSAYIIGIHAWPHGGGDECAGNTMYEAENRLNITV